MSKTSEVIDPAGRCVHDRIERVGTDAGYTDKWLCVDCKEEFYHIDWKRQPGKIQIMEPMKTLRDEFAMAAMTGAWNRGKNDEEMPKWAYEQADAMMEARK